MNLFLDHATTAQLIAAGHFDFINFTGSVGGGRAIEQAAAGFTDSASSSAAGSGYVMEDADSTPRSRP